MNYWLVGATHDNKEMLDTFIEKGYWYCWGDYNPDPNEVPIGNSVPRQLNSIRQIKKGDRIAVKRLQGDGFKMMNILAIGIAKTDMDENEWRVYVDWIAISPILLENDRFKNLTYLPKIIFPEPRKLETEGCTASIHGPYTLEKEKEWLSKIFFI